jgi:hypothetical protein
VIPIAAGRGYRQAWNLRRLAAVILTMEQTLTAVERAFQIARSGAAASVDEIRWALHKEGHLDGFVEGSSIRRQLSGLLKEARGRGKLHSKA